MTGTARRCAAGALLLIGLGVGSPVATQTDGTSRFRVFHHGEEIGFTAVSLTRDEDGWHLEGSGELKGEFQFVLRQLDVRYDAAWRPRFMTLELATPALQRLLGRGPEDHVVVHVAFGLADGGTRTDIVRSSNADWGSNQVSPDTIPLPDLVFGAYEALAARLSLASPGAELRAFVVPRFEATVSVDGVTDEAVRTSSVTLQTKRWRATVRRPEGPVSLDIWVERGRMIRLDLPKDGITVIRQDVAWGQ